MSSSGSWSLDLKTLSPNTSDGILSFLEAKVVFFKVALSGFGFVPNVYFDLMECNLLLSGDVYLQILFLCKLLSSSLIYLIYCR